ncbi:MAG: sodium:calcium antiporter, partial [Bacteroidales bacterium]|nr:sodium:calcium antiporter [Bacteroidales bacterium]
MWTWIFLFLSLTAVVVGAEILVNGSVAIAKKYKISDFIIGATIIGIGTSCPELVVSMVGAIGGNADIAIGNVVGSNICNILLILGATALITPVLITKDNLKFELPYCITLSLLLMLLALNFFSASATALLSRLDGWI